MKKFILLILFITCYALPQDKNRPYYITLDIGGGYSRYFTSMDIDYLNKNGIDMKLRAMWHPEHLLSVGLETGYQYLYNINEKLDSEEFGSSDMKLKLISIPVSLIFSMKIFPKTIPDLYLLGGSGASLIMSTGEFYDHKINNSQIIINYIVAINYLYKVTDQFRIGSELKFTHLSKLEDSNVSIMALISYQILSW